MQTVLIILHLVFSVFLIAVVLLQQGKQAGLSGAVAGGAETFFGKNKARTVDALLKKLTAVASISFIVTSLSLAYVATKPAKEAAAQEQVVNPNGEIPASQEPVADETPAPQEQAETETPAE